MVKPAEKIESIKIHQVSGLGNGNGGGGNGATMAGAGANGGSPITQAVDAIGNMAVQLPALKKLGEEVGISLDGGISGLMDQMDAPAANGAATPPPLPRH